MQNLLFEEALRLEEALQKFRSRKVKTRKLELDCRLLPTYGKESDCRHHTNLKGFFGPLMKIGGPALYWFEITSKNSARELHEKIQTLKQKIDRNVPAFRKGFNSWDSKVLYVGKVKSSLAGRMVTHLGYYRNKNTQGLQLCHWAQKSGLSLRLNYIELPLEVSDMAGLLETKLAKQLNPIFGKHR